MDERVIDLYDDLVHRHLDRRLFLEQFRTSVGSSAVASTLRAFLHSYYAFAETVPAKDLRLATAGVVMPGAVGEVCGYRIRPARDAKLPGVMVIHQNRGSTAYRKCDPAR